MLKLRSAVWILLPIFLSACAQMSHRQEAALKGAAIGAAVGGGMGAGMAAATSDQDNKVGIGAGIGVATGALLGGLLGYLFAEEPKAAPPPAPAPKPTPPAPAPARPTPPPPPPRRVTPPPPPAVVEPAERTIILENILFDFDKTAVKPAMARILDRLVTFLNEERRKTIHLEGHTDSVGPEQYNQGLSKRRAGSVKNYVTQKGVDASRVTVEGFGETKPIADNKTRDGRSRNRRVEVKIR
jgi:outer membrane protein OmpA-like peptidoglycan-associated protein